ncbi:MAG: ATP-binding protein [Kofleriaceae bacterium]
MARARRWSPEREGVVDPYRSAAREARAEAPRDPGIVGDIIAQFADPLAFYRELVQNSIDAGSPSIDVRLEYDPSAGAVRVAVRDRGEGMTRDILENQLLVLFRSTKEQDKTKIGKFGIGFASVLAPNPEVVAVSTSRDGRRLALHLNRDLTYELYDGGPATQTGTTVELDIAMPADQVATFARSSIAALERWCRHASVPINVTAQLPSGEAITARIDRPLALEGALVETRATSDDGALLAIVGLTAPAGPYTGFFNHGLMLHETTEPLLGNVAVKLQDARLGHTLSRDNVRRDAHFERAIEFARSLVGRALPAAAATELRNAAEAGDHARWWKLVRAFDDAKLELPKRSWWFPLIEPLGDRRAVEAGALSDAWSSHARTQITGLLAARGAPVLQCAANDRRFLAALVASVTGETLRDVAAELTCVTPVVQTDEDVALLALVAEHLAAVYRAPLAMTIATLAGVHAGVFAIAGEPGNTPYLVTDDQARRNPLGRKRQTLVISESHAWYRAARRCDPRTAADLITRALLLGHELLDVPRSTALLERTLDQIGLELP